MSGIHTDLNMHRTGATRGAAIPLGSKSTPYYQNAIKHGMQKSKPQSKQAPFCTTFLHETFSLFQHHSNLFETTLLMKTNIDQRSKYTLMQRYNKI
jgi:hypothetical protein